MVFTDIIVTGINVTGTNLTGSDIDPCWLPSAIMQTIGAIYAIFIAVTILLFQTLNSKESSVIDKLNSFNKNPAYSKEFVDSLIFIFGLLTFFVFITEIINGVFLLNLIFNPGYTTLIPESYQVFSLLSFTSFLVTLLYICGISYELIIIFTNIFNENYKLDAPIHFYKQSQPYLSLLSHFSTSYIGLLVNLSILTLLCIVLIIFGYRLLFILIIILAIFLLIKVYRWLITNISTKRPSKKEIEERQKLVSIYLTIISIFTALTKMNDNLSQNLLNNSTNVPETQQH